MEAGACFERVMETAVVCGTVSVSTETNHTTDNKFSNWAKTSILMSKHWTKFFSPDFLPVACSSVKTGHWDGWSLSLFDSFTLQDYESLITTKLRCKKTS